MLEDFLKPLGITQFRLARFFGTDAQSWVNLQAHYDLEIAREKLEGRLHKEVTPMTQVECRVAGGITPELQKRAFV